MKVSTLLLTYNEEVNLTACLEALTWCDDILVLDSGSTDRTVDIARLHGARVMTRPFDDFARQRNHGLDHGAFKHEWVLHLDADEVATPAFRDALMTLEPPTAIDAYNVASKTIFFGRWLRYAGMWPSYQVRLGRRDTLRFKQVGHGQREDLPASRVGIFSEPYLHYAFSHGLAGWLRKHVRYAADEARIVLALRSGAPAIPDDQDGEGVTAGRRRAKARAAKLPLLLRPLARFVYVYGWRQGFRDGLRGLTYALMLAVYEGMISILVYEAMFAGEGAAASNLPRADADLGKA